MNEKETPTLQEAYDRIGLIEMVYKMCDANRLSSDYIDNEKLKEILPINYAWGGYYSNKVEFTDRRTDKTYADEWVRNDEADRLRALTEMNKRIQDFNMFYREQQQILGIEANYQKWGYGEEIEYPLYAFNVYFNNPITWKHKQGQNLVHQVTLNNQYCYLIGLNLDNKNFCSAFNKMIYTWIINMLPKSFNEGRSKFISDEYLLYRPKLEFENWFQAKGVMIDSAPTLLDKNTLPKEAIKSTPVVHSDKSIMENETSVLVEKLKEARELNKKLKNRRYEIAFQEDLESGQLEKVVDSIRFKKNGNINKKALSEHYGTTDKTILNLLIQYAPHLLRNDDAKYLSDGNAMNEYPELLT